MYKVIIADSLPKEIIEKYNKNPNLQVDDKAGISKEDLITAIPEYDGLVVRSRTKANSEIIDAAKNLKVIGRAGAGVDNIDSQAATNRGIIVMNTPGGNTIAAAEHSVAMILSTVRNIPNASGDMKQEKWEKKDIADRGSYAQW